MTGVTVRQLRGFKVLEDSDYGRSVDWWGTGVVMYEVPSLPPS